MYVVIEMQTMDGVVSCLVNQFENRNDAENKYHTVLAAAAVSACDIHTAMMVSPTGNVIKSEYYTH